MAEVFADTSGWACYFLRKQPFYIQAKKLVRWWQVQTIPVATTNYILAELASTLLSPLHVPRPRQISILSRIQAAPWVTIVHIDPLLDNDAWAMWKARSDKEWSLVDCASFLIMQRRGITEALTTDHHFEQAGFVRL